MTSSVTPLIAAVVATAAIMIPMRIQGQLEQSSHHHYKFVDLGTFGGPKSGVNGEPSVQVINNVGTVVKSQIPRSLLQWPEASTR